MPNITATEFFEPYGRENFPSLYDTDGDSLAVSEAIDAVETMFSGVIEDYWSSLPAIKRGAKRLLVENYLIGWYLASRHPQETEELSGDGGMPLTSKSIGGVSVSRKDLDVEPSLKQLESNAFGVIALEMILSAPERFRVYG